MSNSKNVLPIKNDENCFAKNKTILALEMELEEKKFYFICFHEIEYFTFHVVVKSEDVRDAQRYLFNLTIVDGSKVCNYLYGTHLSEIGMPHINFMYVLIIYKCIDNTYFCRIIQIQKKDLRDNQK